MSKKTASKAKPGTLLGATFLMAASAIGSRALAFVARIREVLTARVVALAPLNEIL